MDGNSSRAASGLTQGLTLLEVVLAGAVLAIAITGTMSAWANSQRLQALQREESLAQAAITQVINNMRALPFTQIDNMQVSHDLGTNAANVYAGYSGGSYPAGSAYRLLPGRFKIYMGWDGKGPKTDAALNGVKVSPSAFAGGAKIGNSYWAPASATPEMRVVFLNNELPTESQMGETPQSPGDGVDLDGDGSISIAAMVAGDANKSVYFVDEGQTTHNATPLFPRLLATPIQNPPRTVGTFPNNTIPIADTSGYLNVTSLVIYPVFIQVRWWSAAGLPRDISVFTFFTNRAGSTAPTDAPVIP